jgi:hypothetical protein
MQTLEELCDWFSQTPKLPDVVRARTLLLPETNAT